MTESDAEFSHTGYSYPGVSNERLSVIVPFYDEEQNLSRFPDEVFPALEALGLSWQLVLVDDGSRDGSAAVAGRLVAAAPDAILVSHPHNRGLGAAVRSGFEAATGDLLLTLDADLTFHPRATPRLLERYSRGDVDLVMGSPLLAGFEGVPWYRILLSRGANLLYQLALGRRLTAVTSIFRLYRAESVRDLEITSDGFDINAEVLAKLLLAGGRVAEVPVVLTTREYGVSKLDNLAETRNHLRLMRRIVGWRLAARCAGPRG